MGFRKMSLSEKTITALEDMGYFKPTDVQEKAIPLILLGENIIVRSQTGTGKTAAFGIGIIERLDAEPGKKALVLAPTRELAVQIAKEIRGIAAQHNQKIEVVYGGQSIEPQERAIRKGVDILIATPGRLLDHEERRNVSLSEYQIVVLDEADKMLDMGFKDEMDRIMDGIPERRTVLLFSATVDETILDLAAHYTKGPSEIIELGEKERAEKIREDFVHVPRRKKYAELKKLLREGSYNKVLIFMATKRGVDFLYERLKEDGFRADGIHGDLSQARRERVLESFKEGKVQILVASDVAARGIHVEDIELIVNYDEAQDADTHLHRIGRTGRMGKEGKAITFVESRELENEDRHKEDHPDFAWMKDAARGGGMGGSRSGPPRPYGKPRERKGRDFDSSQDRRRRPRGHESPGRRNYSRGKPRR